MSLRGRFILETPDSQLGRLNRIESGLRSVTQCGKIARPEQGVRRIPYVAPPPTDHSLGDLSHVGFYSAYHSERDRQAEWRIKNHHRRSHRTSVGSGHQVRSAIDSPVGQQGRDTTGGTDEEESHHASFGASATHHAPRKTPHNAEVATILAERSGWLVLSSPPLTGITVIPFLPPIQQQCERMVSP